MATIQPSRPDLTLAVAPATFPDNLFQELSAAVNGPVLRPTDPECVLSSPLLILIDDVRIELTSECPRTYRYADRARTFNGKLKPACRVLVSPLDAHDVSAVITFCRKHGISPSVRSGGYGIAGWAVAGDLVIDMSMI